MSIKKARDGDDMELRALLIEKAAEAGHKVDDDWTHAEYRQHDNADALSDAWLKSRTSYIWRVGVLALWDANKCDWCTVAIGQRREPGTRPEFKGLLHWDDGENDDPARTVKRAMEIASVMHPVFDADDKD